MTGTAERIYEDIARRTQGDIYIGVVGPVRTGKSTFIKRFMETSVIPNIDNVYRKERAKDELPQSGSGRSIMTAEPKFVPEDAVELSLEGSAAFRVRLIDCVGYMVEGAEGQSDANGARMVMTPWFPQEIPLAEAAEIGTRKVIADHSTVGIVVTTDGTITDLPRENYVPAEERVVGELQELGKPFLILLNSASPASPSCRKLRQELEEKYNATTLAVNCLELSEQDITGILQGVLYEFPVCETDFYLPDWVDALPDGHPIKAALYEAIRNSADNLRRVRDVKPAAEEIGRCEQVCLSEVRGVQLGTGVAEIRLDLPRSLFYDTLSQSSGFNIRDDGDLVSLLGELAGVKTAYDRVAGALKDVYENGYGIVMPTAEEMKLEEPEIVRQGGRYGVRLKASAPSIHMIRADIQTEVSPIVGNEKQSEDMIQFLLQEFQGNTEKIWDSNIFGKSFHELVGEDLNSKLKKMPEDARQKLRETLQRIINEGSGGLICIIL